MRRKRIVNLTLKLARASLAVLAMSLVAMLSLGNQALAADTPSPQITLYKDTGSVDTPELKPYGNDSEKRSYVEFKYHITGSNTGSYGVYLSTPSSTLTGSKNDNEDTIDSLEENVTKTLAELPANTWGWRYGTGSTPETALTNVNKEDNYFKAVRPVSTGTIVDKTNADTLGSNNGNQDTIEEHYVIQIGAAIGDITPDTYSGEITVSAVATPKIVANAGTFQNFTTDKCEAIPKNTTTTLEDSRDGKVYLVSRLEDGNCWMVQNLSLWGNTNGTKKTVQAYNYKTGQVYDYELPASSTTGFSDNTAQNMYNGSFQPASPNTEGYDGSGASGKNGANSGSYYSWLTAIANNNGAALPTSNGSQVYTSICPKGWRLPTGGNSSANGEFEQLIKKYTAAVTSGDTFSKGTFATVWNPNSKYVGDFTNGGLDYSGSLNVWWSNTTNSSAGAYYLYEDNGNLYPRDSNSYRLGFSVRCMFEMPKPTPAFFETSTYTMQTMTKDICESATIPNNNATLFDKDGSHKDDPTYIPRVSVKDERDNKKYLIARLADGKCWMVQNLAIGSTTRTLTSADSNVSSDFPLTASTNTDGFVTKTATSNVAYVKGHQDGVVDTKYEGNNPGGYYTWYTATAGTAPSSGEATSSICPKNWRLPTGNTGEFKNLYTTKYGGSLDNFAYAWNGVAKSGLGNVLPGFFVGGSSIGGSGSVGYWWSSTPYSTNSAYSLHEYTSGVGPSSYGSRYNGFSVRCVFSLAPGV